MVACTESTELWIVWCCEVIISNQYNPMIPLNILSLSNYCLFVCSFIVDDGWIYFKLLFICSLFHMYIRLFIAHSVDFAQNGD